MQFKTSVKKYYLLFIVTIFMISSITTFNGCSDDDETVTPPTTVNPNVLITHASPNAPNVDLLVGSSIINANVPYGASTGYQSLTVGNNQLRVNVTGTSTTVIDTTNFYEEGKNYSVFAMDSVSKIKPLILVDDLSSPGSTNAKVRFVHLSPNAPAVDIAVTGGSILFPDYEFKEFSSFSPVAAGTYNLEVRLAGQPIVVLSIPGVVLTAGKIYTVYAKGFVGATGTQALGAGLINNN